MKKQVKYVVVKISSLIEVRVAPCDLNKLYAELQKNGLSFTTYKIEFEDGVLAWAAAYSKWIPELNVWEISHIEDVSQTVWWESDRKIEEDKAARIANERFVKYLEGEKYD